MEYVMFALGGVVFILAALLLGSFLFSRNVAGKVRKALPPAGRFVDVTGGRLHYVDRGEGRPIVLIHGLSGNLHNFGYALIDELARDHRVIAVDRPGCGHSTRINDEWARLPHQAAMIAQLIDALGLEKPLIAGHSLGGAVSLFMALDHPDQVGGLALLAPLTAVQDRSPAVFRGIDIPNAFVRKVIAHTLAMPASLRRGEAMLKIIFGPEEAPADFRTRGGGLLTLRPEAFYGAATDLQAVPLDMGAVQSRYADISVPVGMLYGEDDEVLDCDSHVQAVARHQPDMHLERLPGVGHMPIVTQVPVTAAFIRGMSAKIA